MASAWGASFGVSWGNSWGATASAVASSGGSGRRRLGSIWPQSFPETKKRAIALAKEIYAEARATIPEAAQAALVPVEAVRSQAPLPSALLPKPADIDFRVLAENKTILRAMVAEIETQRKAAETKQRNARIVRKRKDEEQFLMHLIGADF